MDAYSGVVSIMVTFCVSFVCLLFAIRAYTKAATIICPSKMRLDGKVIVVTGANTGVGFATATELARRGAKVILACRSLSRGLAARERLITQVGKVVASNVEVQELDVSCLESVRKFVAEFNKTEQRLDVLVNNAAVLLPTVGHPTTKQGIDATMATNFLGPLLLTTLLSDKMRETAQGCGEARVIFVSSMLARLGKVRLDKLQSGDISRNAFMHYGDSKLALLIAAKSLSKRLREKGITVNIMCPGVVNTEVFRNMNPVINMVNKLTFFKSVKSPFEGAQTAVFLSTDPALTGTTGEFFTNCEETKLSHFQLLDDQFGDVLLDKLTDIFSETSGTLKN